MALLKGKAKTGSDYVMAPAGNHPGVCIGLIDLGTHWESFQGQNEKKVRKVLFVWEIEAEVKEEGKADSEVKRLVIGRDFNIALGEDGSLIYGTKSNIRKLLEGWRGKAYGESEDIDLESIWKKPCLVNVKHDKTNKGKDVARVDSVNALARGMKPLTPEYDCILYSADSDSPIPDEKWLPRIFGATVKSMVESSLEHGGDGRGKSQQGNQAGGGNGGGHEAQADEAPF